MGGAAVGEYHLARRWQRILIALSGPAAGLFLWWLLTLAVDNHEPLKNWNLRWLNAKGDWKATERTVQMMITLTLVLNLANLIPILPSTAARCCVSW